MPSRGACYTCSVALLAPSLALAALTIVVVACSQDESPPTIRDGYGPGGSDSAAGASSGSSGTGSNGIDLGPIEFDPATSCGYTFVDAQRDPSHVYFVVDRSGSMSDAVNGVVKYSAVRTGLMRLVQKIGWRSQIGAVVYPGLEGDQCAGGVEVFPLRPGDAKSYADANPNGPITVAFGQAINVVQSGGTPTGQTLAALVPKLSALGSNTYVILATDGGPNCNTEISCGPERCMLNIENAPICKAANCCDPLSGPDYSAVNCLDADRTVAAVQALSAVGVKTIVVGIPGSDIYRTLLDLMAVAGGVPRPSSPRYYRVDNLDDISSLLLEIGDQVAVSCDIVLSTKPIDKDTVNVFLDQTLVRSDPLDGWTWTGDDRVTLHGKSCADLSAGIYSAARVVVGCPTEIVVE